MFEFAMFSFLIRLFVLSRAFMFGLIVFDCFSFFLSFSLCPSRLVCPLCLRIRRILSSALHSLFFLLPMFSQPLEHMTVCYVRLDLTLASFFRWHLEHWGAGERKKEITTRYEWQCSRKPHVNLPSPSHRCVYFISDVDIDFGCTFSSFSLMSMSFHFLRVRFQPPTVHGPRGPRTHLRCKAFPFVNDFAFTGSPVSP